MQYILFEAYGILLYIQIQYARSETHLIEQLDNMCEKMNSYAESTDPATGKKSYIRTSSRTGEAVTLSNVAISGDIAQKLKHAVSNSFLVKYHF